MFFDLIAGLNTSVNEVTCLDIAPNFTYIAFRISMGTGSFRRDGRFRGKCAEPIWITMHWPKKFIGTGCRRNERTTAAVGRPKGWPKIVRPVFWTWRSRGPIGRQTDGRHRSNARFQDEAPGSQYINPPQVVKSLQFVASQSVFTYYFYINHRFTTQSAHYRNDRSDLI